MTWLDFDKSEFLNRLAFCIEHSNINKMAGISNVNDLGFTKEQYDYIVYLTSYTAMYAIDEYNNMISRIVAMSFCEPRSCFN